MNNQPTEYEFPGLAKATYYREASRHNPHIVWCGERGNQISPCGNWKLYQDNNGKWTGVSNIIGGPGFFYGDSHEDIDKQMQAHYRRYRAYYTDGFYESIGPFGERFGKSDRWEQLRQAVAEEEIQ